jgi:hypothetical protein
VATWRAIEPVAQGLGGSGGELLGGLWVLLVSVAALRTGGLPKVLNWLGVAIGAAGVLSVVPALKDVAYGFGLLEIVWFVWLGVVMVSTRARVADSAVESWAPASKGVAARPSPRSDEGLEQTA